MEFFLTNHAQNSPSSIGGEMNWYKKLSLDYTKKMEYNKFSSNKRKWCDYSEFR